MLYIRVWAELLGRHRQCPGGSPRLGPKAACPAAHERSVVSHSLLAHSSCDFTAIVFWKYPFVSTLKPPSPPADHAMLAQPPHLASPMIQQTLHASLPDAFCIWTVLLSTLIMLLSNQTQLQVSPACCECNAGCRRVITSVFAHSQGFGEYETPPATFSVLATSDSDLTMPLKNWLQLNPALTSCVWHAVR